MSKKGENIFKRKDGRWEGRYIKYYENGKAVYGYVFGKSYSEVKKKKFEALSAVTKTNHKLNQPFIKEIAFQWLEGLKGIRKESTISKYTSQLKNYILPAFGDKHINEINNENLMTFSKRLLTKGGKNGRKLSARTVADILSRMRTIRKFAVLHGYEVKYSVDCVEIPHKSKEIQVLSLYEEKKLLHYLKENFNLTALGILVALFTGVRLGELCALKWSDISFNEREIHVCKTMQRLPNSDKKSPFKTKVEIGEPKSQCSIRTIPVPKNLMKIFQSEYVEDSYLLSGQKKYFVEPRTMENRFKSILKNCGIKNVNFHVLRHTFATRCVELGFDIKSLSEILGHTNVNITLNCYVHPTMKMKHENMNKLNKLF